MPENVAIGTRVIAIRSLTNGILEFFGEGEYIGERIPDKEPFKMMERTNPCIKLDNGKYVWGFMCWWGDVGLFEGKYGSNITERKIVDLPEEVLIDMKPAIDIAEKLFGIHHHAEYLAEQNSDQVVYREEDIIKLLVELGHPKPDFDGYAKKISEQQKVV